jgi:hypothetical protein
MSTLSNIFKRGQHVAFNNICWVMLDQHDVGCIQISHGYWFCATEITQLHVVAQIWGFPIHFPRNFL